VLGVADLADAKDFFFFYLHPNALGTKQFRLSVSYDLFLPAPA
jgi:hypothetical protein